jgi:hypothetical protein
MPYNRSDAARPEAHQRALALFEHKSPEPEALLDEALAERNLRREQAPRFYGGDGSWRTWSRASRP